VQGISGTSSVALPFSFLAEPLFLGPAQNVQIVWFCTGYPQICAIQEQVERKTYIDSIFWCLTAIFIFSYRNTQGELFSVTKNILKSFQWYVLGHGQSKKIFLSAGHQT